MGHTTTMESQHGTELVCGAVYEFHRPKPGERIQVEIVFMHGLQVFAEDLKGAYYKTWTTAYGNEVWPETWLKDKYPNARILSLAYDSCAAKSKTAGDVGPYLLSKSLLNQMVSTAANIGQNDCPVVFVGHSLGGLIAKEVVVRCNSDRSNVEHQNLLRNLKAVFFYATPHGGSHLTESWFGKFVDWFTDFDKSLLVEYLNPKDTGRSHTHSDFLDAVNKDCQFYVVAEGRATSLPLPLGESWIVDELSSTFGGRHDSVVLRDADHMTVCKPRNTKDTGYLHLTKCLDRVIKEESRRLTVELSVENPVGIEGKIDEVSRLLERPGVSMVFLHGMGGIGKTTLSKELYNRNVFKYAKSCYLEKVKSRAVPDVQRDLLRGLCGEELDPHKSVQKQHLDRIKDCLLEQKVLVVVDDVSSEPKDLEQFQVFHALETGSQSKVVVTGRDQSALPMGYMKSDRAVRAVIEPVTGIPDPADLELFLRYALDGVPQGDKEKVETELLGEAKKIVHLCNGLPLSLEVLGKYLGNAKFKDTEKSKEMWVEAFERLEEADTINGNVNERLWSSLRMSYDLLADLEKKMFLDFACIFSEFGRVKKRVIERIWNSPMGVQNLVSQSLLQDQGKRFVMHDQLRDMGRHVLLKEALENYYKHPIYLWQGYEHHSAPYLKFKKLTTKSNVPCIASVEHEVGKNPQQYSKLRLLSVTKCHTPSMVDSCLSQCSEKLRWLRLYECSCVTKIGIQKLCSFGGLRVLEIFNCDNIVELPENVDKLINLAELEVTDCRNLRSLPNTIGELKKLKRLVISWSGLRAVPDSLGALPMVEYLSFEGCDQLTAIEGSQIPTPKLVELKLPIVPTTCLGRCPELQLLAIENGQGVTEFPRDFFKTDMPKLKVVKWCNNVQALEVVLNNPDGSQLVLQKSAAGKSFPIADLEVSRHGDGSISHLSVAKTHWNFFRARKELRQKERPGGFHDEGEYK